MYFATMDDDDQNNDDQDGSTDTLYQSLIELSNSITDDQLTNRVHTEKFLTLIEEQWIHAVPQIFAPDLKINQKFDEKRAFEELLEPLEWFITGQRDTKEALEKLRHVSKPPQLCGRVFKKGEPNYNCRDCSTDSTCVLCLDCFKHSVHREHRYRISHSSSGYCDCGDSEAWKSGATCSMHEQVSSQIEDSNTRAMNEPRFRHLVHRVGIVFSYALDYIYFILKWNQTNLPERLQKTINRKDKQYVSVLYNDEIHTYDSVIAALTKSIKCDNELATEYATAVDREGRCIIFIDNKEKCGKIQKHIETITKNTDEKVLSVKVFNVGVIAHQTFATFLISWIMEILPICEQFRQVFADCLYQPNHQLNPRFPSQPEQQTDSTELCLLEKIMRSDTFFWKSIRVLWHKLFMSGLLLDLEIKKQFARLYTRNYEHLLNDYVRDDHEHSYSVLTISVQIYTVSSIATMLIVEENALEILMNAFLQQNYCSHRSGRFKFESSTYTSIFKRSLTTLLDLEYLLTKTPDDQWTDEMREKFVNGAEAFIKMLKRMQNLDTMIRHVQQHVEYETSWDTGINFALRISPLIRLFTEWAISDRLVYIQVCNIAFRLQKDSFEYYANGGNKQNTSPITNSECSTVRRQYAEKSAMVWNYNVSRKEMSIHIPLSRFVTALLLYLPKFNLVESYLDHSVVGEFTQSRLNVEGMMEMPLRVQVLFAQFRAGMWRRNGYSLINQMLYYHGLRLRSTTYNLDILALQLAAAWLDPNEFMIHLINKYNVDALLNDDTQAKRNDDLFRHLQTVFDEFFRLLYTILVERYTVGLAKVTFADCRINEIIQWLCKKPMSNSELLSQLSYDDQRQLNMIEPLITEVAEFRTSNSSSNSAGRYSLKEQYYERFNPFFYHFTRLDQSMAFETQTRRKRNNKDKYLCFPPPPLPEWMPSFESINNILMCDVTMTIIQSVLEKCVNLKDISFSEIQFQQVLYLIGIGLNEQIKLGDQFKFSDRCIDYGIVTLLEKCSSPQIMQRVALHQSLYDWCLDRFKKVLSTNTDQPMNIQGQDDRAKQQEMERHKRKQMAQARKEKIMEQMKQQQRSFMKGHEKYFKENSDFIASSNISKSSEKMEMESTNQPEPSEPVAFGPQRTSQKPKELDEYTCILCLEKQSVNVQNGRFLLVTSHIQRSTVLSANRTIQTWLNTAQTSPDHPTVFPRSDHNYGPFVNTCTHYMHNDCYSTYIENLAGNDPRRTNARYPRLMYDLSQKEFLCPLCECLSNLVIPMMPTLARSIEPASLQTKLSIDEWLNAMLNIVQNQNSVWINSFDKIAKTAVFNRSFEECVSGLSNDLQNQMNQLKNEYTTNSQKMFDSFSDVEYDPTRHKLMRDLITTIHWATKLDDNKQYQFNGHDELQCFYWSISYSLQILEQCMRVDGSSLSDIRDGRQYITMKAMILLVRSQYNYILPVYGRRIFLYIMNYLLVNTFYQSSPVHLLDIDAFTMLFSLMATAPSFFASDCQEYTSEPPFMWHNLIETALEESNMKNMRFPNFVTPLGNTMDKNLIELMLIFHMVQIILTNPDFGNSTQETSSNADELMDIDVTVSDVNDSSQQNLMVASFCKDILMSAGHKFDEQNLMSKASSITAFIKCKALSFLRCTALWAYFLTDIQWPKSLSQTSTSSSSSSQTLPPPNAIQQYDLLCNYLAIESNLGSLMQSINLKHLCMSWTRHQRLSTQLMLKDNSLVVQPRSMNRLISLPNDFSDLINSVANFTCPNSNGEESRSPTMCLVCGQILCSQNYCCQRKIGKERVGACTSHAKQCSASTGMFLRIRDNKILLLTSRGRGCYLPSPYVDKYGETDYGLIRGHPMLLSSRSYEQLYRLWIRHGIPEKIVHMMQTSNSLASTNWNIM